jgi:hypothetical protein
VHPGDRVRAFFEGVRAETTIDVRRPAYTLELGGEPASVHGPPPLVLVRSERAAGAPAGVSVEVMALAPLAQPPVLRSGDPANRAVTLAPTSAAADRFTGLLPQSDLHAGRLSFECLLPDPARGDLMLVTDAVFAELPAEREAELASFDGSVRMRVSEATLSATATWCIASTSGPPLVVRGHAVTGRVHTILPSLDANPLRSPALLVVRGGSGRVVQFDESSRDWLDLPVRPSAVAGEWLVDLPAPGAIAILE